MSFYRRGTAFLATGKFKPALQDFARVLELKPDFTSVVFLIGINFFFFKIETVFLSNLFYYIIRFRHVSIMPTYLSNRAYLSKLLKTTNISWGIISIFQISFSSHSYRFLFLLKLKLDQSNDEAKSRLDRIYDILTDLGSAKQFMANRDYHNAVEVFSRVLEVNINF